MEADRHNRLPGSPVMCGVWGNGWGGVPLTFEQLNFLISNRHTDHRESLIFLMCFWNFWFSYIFKFFPEKIWVWPVHITLCFCKCRCWSLWDWTLRDSSVPVLNIESNLGDVNEYVKECCIESRQMVQSIASHCQVLLFYYHCDI